MRKTIQITSLLLLISGFAFSQKYGFDAGIFFGLNGIHIEGDNQVLYNSTNGTIWGTGGITAGLIVKRNFTENFYWSFDLRYIRKGSVYEFTNIQGVQDFESIKFDYAELPISVGYNIRLEKRYLYFEVGAAVAKLLNSKKIISDYSYGQDISLFDQFKDYDYSFIVALKYSFNKKEKTLIGFRVARSFITIHEKYKLYNFDYGVELSYYIN